MGNSRLPRCAYVIVSSILNVFLFHVVFDRKTSNPSKIKGIKLRKLRGHHTKLSRILKYLKQKEFVSGRTLDQRTVYDYLRKNWKDAFRDYFSFLTRKGFKLPGDNNLDINKITDKLSELCTFRNCIVHNGGYAPPIINGKRTQFEGIRRYVNLIYVSNEGIKSVSQFTREIISILSAHDWMRFRS